MHLTTIFHISFGQQRVVSKDFQKHLETAAAVQCIFTARTLFLTSTNDVTALKAYSECTHQM